MNAMNSSTLHRCVLLKKCPTGLVCHQSVPPIAMVNPDTIARAKAASVATPNTYTQEATYAGCRSGSSFCGGNVRSAHRLVRAVHIFASASSPTAPGADSLPGAGSATAGKVRFRCGKGSSSAAPKITTMTAITTRFATEISKIDQCKYVPG